MGYPELLRVIEGEAAREARDLGARAEAEREQILSSARAAAAAATTAVAARARAGAAAARTAGREALDRERDRVLLVARRQVLEGLLAAARAALEPAAGAAAAASDDAALVARLLAGLAPALEADPDGPGVDVVVDPGAGDAARAALARLGPGLLRRAIVREAAVRRGGVEVIVGRRVLDETLPARLERAWDALEPEIAGRLFGGVAATGTSRSGPGAGSAGGGPWRGSTT